MIHGLPLLALRQSYGLHWIRRQDRRCPSTDKRGGSRSHYAPGIPEAPKYLPEMKDAVIVKQAIQALSLRIVAVHGRTGTGKSTVFPLEITHAEGLKQASTVCAQPRRILAQQLCERVRSNRKMRYNDRTVGYMIARESTQRHFN